MFPHPLRKTISPASMFGLFAGWIYVQQLVKLHGYSGRPLFWTIFTLLSIVGTFIILAMSDTFIYYMVRPLASYFLPKHFQEHSFLYARSLYREYTKGKLSPVSFVDSVFEHAKTDARLFGSMCTFLALMEFDKQSVLSRFQAPSDTTIREAIESAYAAEPWKKVYFVSVVTSTILLLVLVFFPSEFAKWIWAGPVAFLASKFIQ